jgi:hypothetical protein
MRLEQVEQRALALAEVAPAVVEEERLRVLGTRRKRDLELVLHAGGPEPLGVQLGPVELAAGVEVRELEGVEPAAHLRPAQRMLAGDAPERLVGGLAVGHRSLDHRQHPLGAAIELAVAPPLAAEQRPQLVDDVRRERVRARLGAGVVHETQGSFEVGGAQPVHGSTDLTWRRRG